MKKFKTLYVLLAVILIAGLLTGCSGSKKEETTTTEAVTEAATEAPTEEATEEATEETTEAPTEEETEEATEEAIEAPEGDQAADIVIEYGDFDGIVALAKDAQNKKVAEGTTAQISGFVSTGANPAVMEKNPDNDKESRGLTMYLDGDWDIPADGTDIDVIGTFTDGGLFMEFHVDPANITVK